MEDDEEQSELIALLDVSKGVEPDSAIEELLQRRASSLPSRRMEHHPAHPGAVGTS